MIEMTDSEREVLFQRGVDAVRQLTGTTDEVYICPICGTAYNRLALDDRILTKEHVPPDSQNGHVLLLTCKECNNRSGSILDKAIADRQIMLNFTEAFILGKGCSSRRARFQLADQPLNVWTDVSNEIIQGR